MKDLLRFMRRLKKQCRDPRAVCRKKVRFSTTEMQALGQQGGFQRGWKERSLPLLKSCLSNPKRDSREDSLRKPSSIFCSQTELAKPGSTGPTDTPLALLSQWRACKGCAYSSRAEAGHLLGSASRPSSQSDDGSSVDRDDSTQLESVSSSENRGGAGVQPQAWLFSPARAGGAGGAGVPLSGVRTRGRCAFPLLRGPEACWHHPGAPVGLCLPEGHPQIGEIFIFTKTRDLEGPGLPLGTGLSVSRPNVRKRARGQKAPVGP